LRASGPITTTPSRKSRVAQQLGHGFGGNGGSAHGVARVDFDELLEYAGS
jgi:hypothetical protein